MIYCFFIDIIKIMDFNFIIIIKRKEKKNYLVIFEWFKV